MVTAARWSWGGFLGRVLERFPLRRRMSEQVPREEVEALVLAGGAAVAVTRARDDEQLEVLVVFDPPVRLDVVQTRSLSIPGRQAWVVTSMLRIPPVTPV